MPIIGYQEVIQGLTRDDVYSYYKLAYEPHNLVFCVVGDVDPESTVKTVARKLGRAGAGPRVLDHDLAPEPPVLSPPHARRHGPQAGPGPAPDWPSPA